MLRIFVDEEIRGFEILMCACTYMCVCVCVCMYVCCAYSSMRKLGGLRSGCVHVHTCVCVCLCVCVCVCVCVFVCVGVSISSMRKSAHVCSEVWLYVATVANGRMYVY